MFVYMVYVQDINGKPMMPTTRHGKVRRLLKDKKAVVVNLCPFTIKLMYVTSDYKQEIVHRIFSEAVLSRRTRQGKQW